MWEHQDHILGNSFQKHAGNQSQEVFSQSFILKFKTFLVDFSVLYRLLASFFDINIWEFDQIWTVWRQQRWKN